MKKVLLIAGSGVFLMLGVAFGLGATLPVDHVATVQAVVPTSQDSAYMAVIDVNAYPGWRPSVDRIEEYTGRGLVPVVGDRWAEVGATGSIPIELTESTPTRVVTTIVGENLGFGGRWILDLTPSGVGTSVSITEEGQVYSPLFRFVSRFIMGYHRTARTYLEDLGRRFGEEVQVNVVR